MRITVGGFLVLLLCLSARAQDTTAAAAEETVDRYIETFNTMDATQYTSTMHFPHVAFGDGQVVIYRSREAALDVIDIKTFSETTGWRRTELETRKTVQSDGRTVHVEARMTRYNAEDEPMMTFDAMFIVEELQEKWGVRAYSRLLPQSVD